jgi:hypothetical protein
VAVIVVIPEPAKLESAPLLPLTPPEEYETDAPPAPTVAVNVTPPNIDNVEVKSPPAPPPPP